MRPGTGCTSCRQRHLKCITEPSNTVCTRCIETGRECHFGPKFKFKHVLHVDDSSSGPRSRQDLTYGKDQVWVSTRKRFNFILEDGAGLEYGVPEDEDDSASGLPQRPDGVAEGPRKGPSISSLLSPIRSTPAQHINSPELNIVENTASSEHAFSPQNISALGQEQGAFTPRAQSQGPPTAAAFASPTSIRAFSKRNEERLNLISSPLGISVLPVSSIIDGPSPSSLPTPGSLPHPNLSRREAFLVQHFINKIGPWVDVCDLASHFAHEVPRRGMRNPMVLYSILAVTSRHLSISHGDTEQEEASYYHGECLRLVIDQLSGPESLYDDNLLATVVCMRMYEEMDASNGDFLHLQGIDRLLRAIPSFAHSGGLGEAACWQSLRQDIYVAMYRSQSPSLDLDNFNQSSVFTFRDDAACANVVVLIFAKILRLAFAMDTKKCSTSWHSLAIDVESWNDRRLRIFQPIYFEDFDVSENRPFPVIHMINPPQVAAIQYYHSCKIFLLLHRPDAEQLSHFHAAKKRRAIERDVVYHLAAIVGLAKSNPFVENANFTAHHLLRVGGYCITHHLQRQEVIEFLKHVGDVMGWSTVPTIDLLKEQWNDLDQSD